ncbi:DUF4381 domain-containing protein [Pseudomonas sp. GD03860]|uniref:DUF4381 domain-containing protein n=1 Tax=Pseudomonas TaxID=286 RepID=UPI00236481BE|nr:MULTISPECIES: DUF4381 domain-containing protein [Pseudomonas]MDD2060995.1 DUF4381 domain-containing protein [Pseudomonas putida]MDH0635369.1 DUF4381 domain-containing protein [Pseudomonas sp. GD03860]
MTANVPSIDQLKELALPPAPSYLPQTWGWALLAAILVLAVLVYGAWRYRRWQLDRYRREALGQLATLETAMADEHQRIAALRAVPELLKRVALSMPKAPAVATLHGSDWQAFLDTHSRTPLPADFAEQLARLAYAPDSTLMAFDAQPLMRHCRTWVEHHHVAV